MALETFKAQLKAKAKTLGVTNLSNKRIDAYAALLEKQNPNLSTDDDHAEKVDGFLELVDIKEIASFDDWQNSKKKGGKEEKKEEPKKDEEKTDPPANDADVPAWAKKLIDQNEALTQTVAQLQAKETKQTMQQRLKESLKDIPESFYDEWSLPEKEEDFEPHVEKVKTKWEAFTKDNPVQPATAGGGHKPSRGSSGQDTKEASKEEVSKVLDSII